MQDKIKTIITISTSLLILLYVSVCKANLHDDMREVASQFLSQQAHGMHDGRVKILVGKIDPRLNLASCKRQDIDAFIPSNQTIERISTLGIRCKGEKPWSIYLPVRVDLLKQVVVARNTLVRNQKIKSSDLLIRWVDIQRMKKGYFTKTKDVVGKIVKRYVRMGKVIEPLQLKRAMTVHRGELVHIMVMMNNMKIQMKGRALRAGSLGDTIPVKNLSSKRIIEAKVTGQKRVEVAI